MLTGCAHVKNIAKDTIVETPVAAVAAAHWNAEAARLFENQTAAWTQLQKSARKKLLGGADLFQNA